MTIAIALIKIAMSPKPHFVSHDGELCQLGGSVVDLTKRDVRFDLPIKSRVVTLS